MTEIEKLRVWIENQINTHEEKSVRVIRKTQNDQLRKIVKKLDKII